MDYYSSSRSSSAQSKVEYYLRAESRLSHVPKPEPIVEESRAKYAWRVVRHCVRDAIDLTLQADSKDVTVTHGVQASRKVNHAQTIKQMIYNRTTKEFLTMDGHLLRVFHPDGRKKEVLDPEEPFNRLMHATQANLYLGWTYGETRMMLMTSEFEVTSTCNALGPVLSLVYNENIGEVVTCGPGFVTSWVFRYGGRHLLPRKITQEGLTEHDHLEQLALEHTASRTQRAFACTGKGVAIFNLYEGKLIDYKTDLHVGQITSILFFNPLKYLVTAAKDGSIKVWDEVWHLQLVFVGHCSAVTSLAVYPYGPNIMSASQDQTIRVWSLETCDEVDMIKTDSVPHFLGTVINTDTFFSVSDMYAEIWKVKHVHMLHTRVNQKVSLIKVTDHPEYPVRAVLLCRDASVRISAPDTGDVLTTLIMPSNRKLVDAAYAVADNMLFACFANGDIVKAYTGTNPCTVMEQWPCKESSRVCNYLLVYEYVISADVASDTWGGFKRIAATRGLAAPGTPSTRTASPKPAGANRTLLLGGRKDGKICVFHMDTGEVEFEIEAHGSKGVLSMMANSKADQLISAGLDNIIKVWRLYPYAQESLAPLMSFYCAHTPIYMTVLKNKLAVAFQEHTSATYSIVMYNLQGKNRHDHGPDDDHQDSINGVTACNKMKLLASCSHDGTVRIWNEVNNLIRVIRLNATPSSISFCSQKGDLLLGIGDHVHKIDYKMYMPKSYRFKMVSMKFPIFEKDEALPFDENLLNQLSKDDQRRLKNARSSFKFTHFMDILTEEENDEVMREKRVRDEAYAKLEAREQELSLIKDGELEATRKPKATKKTRAEAFNKYLSFFYTRNKYEMPKEEMFIEDKVKEILEEQPKEVKHEWRREKEPTGFFPGPSAAAPVRPCMPGLEAPAPRADGIIPNSVLARLLWPREEMEEEEQEGYRPPVLDEDQLALIDAERAKRGPPMTEQTLPKPLVKKLMFIKKFAQKGENRTLVMDWSDEEKPAAKDDDDDELTDDDLKKPPAGLASIMSKVEDKLAKEPSPEPEEEQPVAATPSPVPKPAPSSRPPTRQDIVPRTISPEKKPSTISRKSITKFVAPKPPSEPAPTASTRTIRARPPTPPQRTPSPPPRPPTPLPSYITQYKDETWFAQYFPNLNEKTMPKPWSVTAFVGMLVKILRITDYDNKIHVVDALMQIHSDEGIPCTDIVYKTLYSVFNHHTTPPTSLNPVHREFIVKGIDLLHAMGHYDRDFYMELLVQFMESDKHIRQQVLGILHVVGLKDPHDYLTKELDGWDVWNLEEKERPGELRKMCKAWLDRWLTSFKIHLQDSIERLKRGGTVAGRATPSQVGVRGSPSGGRSILRKDTGRDSRIMTVTFDKPPDDSTVDAATYLDALNYFCDMELEKNLEKMKGGRSEDQKNTVLVLPKITTKGALVRLGETHTSKCRADRETSLAVDLRLPAVTSRGRMPPPGELYGFPNCINLPLKSVNMNPFLTEAEKQELQQAPLLLMLQTSQKYFVHDRSVVPPQDIY